MNITYKAFSHGPARGILRSIVGFDPTTVTTWDGYEQGMRLHIMGNSEVQAKLLRNPLSGGEKVVLMAALMAASFSSEAAEIMPDFLDRAWPRNLDTRFQATIAATFARLD